LFREVIARGGVSGITLSDESLKERDKLIAFLDYVV